MNKKMEDKVENPSLDFEIDDTTQFDVVPVQTVKEEVNVEPVEVERPVRRNPVVNILRNERVNARFLPKSSGIWGDNPKHVLSGGKAENAVTIIVTPRLRSGEFKNVLTNAEKAFLEEALGLEYNALSSIRRTNNFWKTVSVRLTKGDNYFDLSSPQDYIKYKILLANDELIAPSLKDLQDSPKESYQFVLIEEGEETKQAQDNMTTVMKCYKEYGKIETDSDTLRVIIETLDGRPTAANSKLEFLQTKINTLIQSNSKTFLKVITDPLLNTKVLIKRATEAGIISNRDNHYYLREDNSPLCGPNGESTLNTAAEYLNMPKHQDILFAIQAKLKD